MCGTKISESLGQFLSRTVMNLFLQCVITAWKVINFSHIFVLYAAVWEICYIPLELYLDYFVDKNFRFYPELLQNSFIMFLTWHAINKNGWLRSKNKNKPVRRNRRKQQYIQTRSLLILEITLEKEKHTNNL